MEYIKYLIKNPSKIFFIIFVNFFTIPLLFFLFFNYETVIEESTLLAYIAITIIAIGTFIAGNYQPYKEWKDGQSR